MFPGVCRVPVVVRSTRYHGTVCRSSQEERGGVCCNAAVPPAAIEAVARAVSTAKLYEPPRYSDVHSTIMCPHHLAFDLTTLRATRGINTPPLKRSASSTFYLSQSSPGGKKK